MIVVAKKEGAWRGRAIAVKHRQVASNRVPVTVKTEQGDVGFLNIHLPRRYTLNETGNQTAELVVMGDFSETFTRRGLHAPQPEFQSCCSGWRSSAWRRRRNKSTRHPTTPLTHNCQPADSTTSSPGAPCQFNEGGSGNSDTYCSQTTTGSSSTSSEGSGHLGRQNKGTICDMDRDSSKHPRKLRTLEAITKPNRNNTGLQGELLGKANAPTGTASTARARSQRDVETSVEAERQREKPMAARYPTSRPIRRLGSPTSNEEHV